MFYCSYSVVTRLWASRSNVQMWAGAKEFLFSIMSRLAPDPTHLPTQWVLVTFSTGVNRPECEACHLPPSSTEIKNDWNHNFTPPTCLFTNTPKRVAPLGNTFRRVSKLRNLTITFVMPVHLSIHMKQINFCWADCHEICYLRNFWKNCQANLSFI